MNRRRYWKNRIPFLLTNLVCMAALTVFLLVCGNSISAVLLILVVWAVVLLTAQKSPRPSSPNSPTHPLPLLGPGVPLY